MIRAIRCLLGDHTWRPWSAGFAAIAPAGYCLHCGKTWKP